LGGRYIGKTKTNQKKIKRKGKVEKGTNHAKIANHIRTCLVKTNNRKVWGKKKPRRISKKMNTTQPEGEGPARRKEG